MRKSITVVAALALAGLLATVVLAGTVSGTAKNDVLRGTGKADTINGKAGNDKLYGLGGNDKLAGGPGNDLLVGGAGKDRFLCGPGKDAVSADSSDVLPGADCETVTGLPKPAISIGDATGNEGNSGTTQFSFPITLSAASAKPVSVGWATANGTATAGSDFQDTSGKVVFSAGQTSKTISVSVTGDTVFEPDETFTIALSEPVNATIADGSAVGTIKNDDVAKAKAGHYHGQIPSGGAVDFDVSGDGTVVSNLVILPFMTCNPSSGSGIYQFRFGSPAPIQPDLTFSANGSGTGVTVSFTGKFTLEPALASGTLQIHLSYDQQGTHYECDTGNAIWAALWRG